MLGCHIGNQSAHRRALRIGAILQHAGPVSKDYLQRSLSKVHVDVVGEVPRDTSSTEGASRALQKDLFESRFDYGSLNDGVLRCFRTR